MGRSKQEPTPLTPATVAEVFAHLSDAFMPAIEVAHGHKRQAMERGFSEEAAEDMATTVHELLLSMLMANTSVGRP